ncbi:MAG TPA: hypothetical protein VKB86_07415, partial [Pyrinomonadaceae bacterium]|nr:hypothetical protein [Pyrinomonadaceae bacterium]
LSTDIPELLKRAHECGARQAFMTMLRLPGSVAEYFEERLREKLPTKAERVLNRIREARDGRLNSCEFGERMRGKGEYWEAQEKLFHLYCKRLGFNKEERRTYETEPRSTFRRPSVQARLFD